MAEQPKVYLARAGGSGEDEEYALDNKVAIIGYRDFPSLANAKNYADVIKIVTDTKGAVVLQALHG